MHNRADVIGRATAGVLAQTFGDLEVVVVDDGSDDDTVAAARAVSDGRVRIVRQEHAGLAAATTSGIVKSHGEWCAVLDPDDEVAPGWLARLGRLIDSTGASLVSCGGDQRHLDGSFTNVAPRRIGGPDSTVAACFRTGAFVAKRQALVDLGAYGCPGDERTATEVGERLVAAVQLSGGIVAWTPESLVQWNEPVAEESTPQGEQLRLRWALQAIDALARTPIPDGELLARYATIGGVAAARLRELAEARRLFTLALRVEPGVAKHWARLAVACLGPVSDRVWESGVPASEARTGAAEDRATAAQIDAADDGGSDVIDDELVPEQGRGAR